MPCIHGLDEISCPNCRILRATLPKKIIKKKNIQFLRFENPFYSINSNLNNKLDNEFKNKKLKLPPSSLIPKPNIINEIPNFENKMFLERIKELDLTKKDKFGISKKITLEDPEWKFEKED